MFLDNFHNNPRKFWALLRQSGLRNVPVTTDSREFAVHRPNRLQCLCNEWTDDREPIQVRPVS